MPNTSECIASYLRAKDENRPHLMRFAFAETARLETIVETNAISFPPLTQGLNKIAQVLVRDFVNTYENIYTFCFAYPQEQPKIIPAAGLSACRTKLAVRFVSVAGNTTGHSKPTSHISPTGSQLPSGRWKYCHRTVFSP